MRTRTIAIIDRWRHVAGHTTHSPSAVHASRPRQQEARRLTMPVQERRRVIWHMPVGAPRAPGLKTEPHPQGLNQR